VQNLGKTYTCETRIEGAAQIERSFKETSWMAFIEVINLFKRFKKVLAFNHIQIEVNEGE